MSFLLLALLVFGVGASVTRLVTRDSILETFRDRWQNHWAAQQDKVLRDAAAILPASKTYDSTVEWQDRRIALMREIGDRSEAEAAVPFAASRAKVQPWTAISYRLIRLRSMIEFIGCPWCVGFWTFLLAWIFAWGVQLGFAYDVAGGPFWAVLPALALGYRWLYALIAGRADAG